MPYKSEKIPIPKDMDRRYKIDDEKKERVRELYFTENMTQREIERRTGVSRRYIGFILFPETYEQFKKERNEAKVWKNHYDKDRHRIYMRRHRRRKQILFGNKK